MSGNVWEWTSDFFTTRHPEAAASPCCPPRNPRVTSAEQSRVAGDTVHGRLDLA